MPPQRALPASTASKPGQRRGPRHLIHQKLQSTAQPTSSSGGFNEKLHPRGRAGSSQGGKFIRAGATDEPAAAAAQKIGVQQLTEQAIKDFQRKHGLVVDGVIGHQTAAALAGDQNAKDVKTGELTPADVKAIVDMAKHPAKPSAHGSSARSSARGGKKGAVHLPKLSQQEFEQRAAALLQQYPLSRRRAGKSRGTIGSVSDSLFGPLVTKAIVEANSAPLILGEHAVEPVVTKAVGRFDERKHPRGADGQFISKDDVVSVANLGHGQVVSVSGGNVRVKLDSGKTVTAAPDTITHSADKPRTKQELRQLSRDHQRRLKELDKEQAAASKEVATHSNAAAKLITSNPKRYDEERQKADEAAARVRAALDERDQIMASLEGKGPTDAVTEAVQAEPAAVPDMMGAIQELIARLGPNAGNQQSIPGTGIARFGAPQAG